MELKIDINNKEKITKLSFSPDYAILVSEKQTLFAYPEVELKFIFNIVRVDTPLHNRHSYVLRIDSSVLIFQTQEKTVDIPYLEPITQLVALLKEKHPFKKISFQFNTQQDVACSLLAVELEEQLKKITLKNTFELPSFFIMSSRQGEFFVRKESYFMSPKDGLWLCIGTIFFLAILYVFMILF